MKHSPMKIDHVLNDIVMLVLDGHEILKELEIDKNKIYVKVVGYDEYGIWIFTRVSKHLFFKRTNPQKKNYLNPQF